MRVLIVHCKYQKRGGEDVVFDVETTQLRHVGVKLDTLEFSNNQLAANSLGERLRLATGTVWACAWPMILQQKIRSFKPDVVHFHNTFPGLSPRAIHVCAGEGVPCIQTLHNYRALCAGAMFLRDARVCEKCRGGRFYYGVMHACYRDSRAASAAVVAMQYVHWRMGTWAEKVSRYIALTEFAKSKYVQAGISPERIAVKGNSLSEDPGQGDGDGGYALYVGRISAEKGVRVLIDAWQRDVAIPLKVAGDGPLLEEVQQAAKLAGANIEFCGNLAREEIFRLLQGARVLLVPSQWFEGFPMTVVESYACGTPIIASDIGSLSEIVDDSTGLKVPPGDPEALRDAVAMLWNSPELQRKLRIGARRRYVERYNATVNTQSLLGIYESVIAQARLHLIR